MPKPIKEVFNSDNKRKTVKGIATVAVLASLLAGMAFSGPADIAQEANDIKYNTPPIVMDIDDYGNATVDDDDDDATEEKKNNGGFLSMFRQAVLSMPQILRILVVTPLWLIGTGLMTLAGLIMSSPIGTFLISLAVGFGILVGLYAITAKTLFPDVPMKDILSKKNLTALAVAAIGLAAVDAVAPLFWKEYPLLSMLVKLLLGAGVIAILTMKVKKLSNTIQSGLGLA